MDFSSPPSKLSLSYSENVNQSLPPPQNFEIKIELFTKFLGVLFDKKLNWIPHIKTLKAKCLQTSNILPQNRMQPRNAPPFIQIADPLSTRLWSSHVWLSLQIFFKSVGHCPNFLSENGPRYFRNKPQIKPLCRSCWTASLLQKTSALCKFIDFILPTFWPPLLSAYIWPPTERYSLSFPKIPFKNFEIQSPPTYIPNNSPVAPPPLLLSGLTSQTSQNQMT